MDETPPVIDSRSAFAAALHWGFDAAFAAGARRVVCIDDDYADWPWDDAILLQGLTDWLKLPQRRLQLLARRFDDLPQRFPRFVAWRAAFSHAVEAWQAPEEQAQDLPTVLVSDGAVVVHLIDAEHWRGRAERDERKARVWCEEADALLQRSERAFAVRTLGL